MKHTFTNRVAFKKLAKKRRDNKKIKVCFSVVFDSVFPLAHVFELMCLDDFFDPFIAVLPDESRGADNKVECFVKTVNKLKTRYPEAKIARSYDFKQRSYYDFATECDLYCPANPYDTMVHDLFKNKRFMSLNIPIFYSSYTTGLAKEFTEDLASFDFWRIYANTKVEYEACAINNNARLSGFAKMDKLAAQTIINNRRKKIIIAPNLAVDNSHNLFYPNFLIYSELFLNLPKLYPDVDFCFRPHPLLKTNLKRRGMWGAEKTDSWFEEIEKYDNVELQEGGDYLHTFANSDGMIHDGLAFIANYLFTEKPACFIYPPAMKQPDKYNKLGRECLGVHYSAQSEKDIIDFIENVIINGNDILSEERISVSKKLKYNFPYASQFIVDDIKNEILRYSS